jgi:ubiquitin-like protein Nedd8
MPARGKMSAQSLAAITYHEAVPGSRPVREQSVGKIEISINILNGHEFAVLMGHDEEVQDLKLKIEANTGIPPWQQQLVFNGRQLNDERTMDYYKIKRNCVIFCVPKDDTERKLAVRRTRKACCF